MKGFVFAGLVFVGLAGCTTSACRTHDGLLVQYIKPPTVEVTTPILVQGGNGMLSAHPMGASAGPVVGGQFEQGAALTPTVISQAPPVRVTPRMAAPPCSTPEPAERLPMPKRAAPPTPPAPPCSAECTLE
jgi:hypothetical protein